MLQLLPKTSIKIKTLTRNFKWRTRRNKKLENTTTLQTWYYCFTSWLWHCHIFRRLWNYFFSKECMFCFSFISKRNLMMCDLTIPAGTGYIKIKPYYVVILLWNRLLHLCTCVRMFIHMSSALINVIWNLLRFWFPY